MIRKRGGRVDVSDSERRIETTCQQRFSGYKKHHDVWLTLLYQEARYSGESRNVIRAALPHNLQDICTLRVCSAPRRVRQESPRACHVLAIEITDKRPMRRTTDA